jgi:hypothetical protein
VDVPLHRDGGDLCNLGCGGFGVGVGGGEGEDAVDGGLGAAGEVHGVAACCYVLDAFGVDGAGEDGGCYRSIAGHFVRLLCDILDEAALGSEHRLWSVVQFETYRATPPHQHPPQ